MATQTQTFVLNQSDRELIHVFSHMRQKSPDTAIYSALADFNSTRAIADRITMEQARSRYHVIRHTHMRAGETLVEGINRGLSSSDLTVYTTRIKNLANLYGHEDGDLGHADLLDQYSRAPAQASTKRPAGGSSGAGTKRAKISDGGGGGSGDGGGGGGGGDDDPSDDEMDGHRGPPDPALPAWMQTTAARELRFDPAMFASMVWNLIRDHTGDSKLVETDITVPVRNMVRPTTIKEFITWGGRIIDGLYYFQGTPGVANPRYKF